MNDKTCINAKTGQGQAKEDIAVYKKEVVMEITSSSKCPCGSRKRFDECCESKIAVFGNPVWMTNFDIWTSQYQERRYLEHLSQEDLIVREDDIVANVSFLKDDLSKGVHIDWVELWAHVQIELAIRENRQPEPLVNRIKDEKLPSIDRPGLLDAVKTFRSMDVKEGSYWVKFGEYRYLKDTLEKGVLRIAPASAYSDPSLNLAQRDSELELEILSLPSEVIIEPLVDTTGKPDGRIRPLRNVEYKLSSPRNYYACCIAMTFDHRLFGDFNADCALIIKDCKEFLQSILGAFKAKVRGCKGGARPVIYFDPLHSEASQFPVCFSKHFRYSYQREYRIVWFPPIPFKQFEPIFVEMGSLKDICDIVCLKN